MKTWYVWVRRSIEPGSMVSKLPVVAPDPFTAISVARSMFGPLLLSEAAMSS